MSLADQDALVLDNSVFSLLYSTRARDEELARWYSGILRRCPRNYLPFQTLAEALTGAEVAGWGAIRTSRITALTAHFILVVPTWPIITTYARLTAHTRRRGRALNTADAWVAACAVELGKPLLHHDADFERLEFPGLETVTLL